MQESGLRLKLLCTSALWGQCLMLSHPESLRVLLWDGASVADGLMAGILVLARVL